MPSPLQPSRARDVLARPLVLGAILILALNDHVLKAAWPGFVTGKLSDVTGLFALPLLLWAVADLVRPQRRPSGSRPGRLWILAGVSAAGFAALKTVPWVRQVYVSLHAALGVPVHVTPDLTDLACLPMVLVAAAYGAWHLRRTRPRSWSPAIAGVGRATVIVAFAFVCMATSQVRRMPIHAQARVGDGQLRVLHDERAYHDRPFEVILPDGWYRWVRVTGRGRNADYDPQSEGGVPIATLLELEPGDRRLLERPLRLAVQPELWQHGYRTDDDAELVPVSLAPPEFGFRIEVERADGTLDMVDIVLEEEQIPGECEQ